MFCLRFAVALMKKYHSKKIPTDPWNIHPQLLVYEGNPFIFVFWGTFQGLFQGSVEIFSESRYRWRKSPSNSEKVFAMKEILAVCVVGFW